MPGGAATVLAGQVARRWATGRSRATTPPSPGRWRPPRCCCCPPGGVCSPPPLALLAALSRVFVGVHYPHDVLAGLLLGVAVTLLAHPVGGPGVLAETLRRRSATALREPVPTAPGPRH